MGLGAGGLMQTHIDLKFADGTYTFKLGLAQINELETKCGTGIGAIYARLLKGRYRAQDGEEFGLPLEAEFRNIDLVETIRQGLIGGGRGEVDGQSVVVTTIRANELVERYVVDRPRLEAWETATAVLSALIEGYEPPKKDEPGEGPAAP